MANEGVDEEADSHPGSTAQHRLTTADVLNHPETDEGGCNVDGTQDNRSDVGVAETCSSEDSGAVVEAMSG